MKNDFYNMVKLYLKATNLNNIANKIVISQNVQKNKKDIALYTKNSIFFFYLINSKMNFLLKLMILMSKVFWTK